MPIYKKTVCFVSIILLISSLSACNSGSSVSERGPSGEPAAKQLNEYIADKVDESGIPGLAAAIVVKGNVVWSNGFGLADKENGTAFTADTIINIASVSKTILGCSVMIAVERGLVGLDEDVNSYLKDFSVHNPYNADDTITLRELATHTSGIVDRGEVYGNTYFAGKDSPISLKDFVTDYLSPTGSLYDSNNFIDTSQGPVYHYSNIGAAFAAHILESVTGQSFAEFTEENIFKPLNMDDTSWLLADTDLAEHATVYDEEGAAVRPYGLTTYPDGGLRTSASDLGKFLAMVMNGGEFNGVRIMKKSSVEEMLRPQFEKGNKPEGFPLPNEGIFWQTDVSSADMIGHTGGDVGVCSYMCFMPSGDIGVIVMANSSGTTKVVEAMKQIIRRLMENANEVSADSREETIEAKSSAGDTIQKIKETDKFIYYCAPDDVKIADEIDALMGEKCPEISERLNFEYSGKITVEIYPDQKSYDESSAKQGMQGSPAYSDNGIIIMVSPKSPIKVNLPYEERLMMAVHEYVHIVLGNINGEMPIWLNEGLASYLGSTDGYDSICRFAFPQLGEISFQNLWSSYYELPAPDVYSCSAVRLIIERFGYEKLNGLLRDPGSFESILSMTTDEFNVIWNDYINKNFKNG